MLANDSPLQLQDPRVAGRRELITGRVAAAAGEVLTGTFLDARLEIEPDAELVVYYEAKRKFMQQAARAVSVERDEEGSLRLELKLVGEPVPAEGREVYRVPCSGSGIAARLSGEDDCPLLDVASLGFAVNATAEHAIGRSVEVDVEWQGEVYTGTVCVQSVRTIGRGRTRYGMRYLDDERAAGTLKRGLARISIEVERQHLRNQSGR